MAKVMMSDTPNAAAQKASGAACECRHKATKADRNAQPAMGMATAKSTAARRHAAHHVPSARRLRTTAVASAQHAHLDEHEGPEEDEGDDERHGRGGDAVEAGERHVDEARRWCSRP